MADSSYWKAKKREALNQASKLSDQKEELERILSDLTHDFSDNKDHCNKRLEKCRNGLEEGIVGCRGLVRALDQINANMEKGYPADPEISAAASALEEEIRQLERARQEQLRLADRYQEKYESAKRAEAASNGSCPA